jgi:hypothetical protein
LQNILTEIYQAINYPDASLIAVSKTYPASSIEHFYQLGHRDFGENKVQEMTEKQQALPSDIKWHMIGHLQSNKVKYIAPYVYLIHSVDSTKLLETINKEALKNDRVINCLLQAHIASEETKFGFSTDEIFDLVMNKDYIESLSGIRLIGLMGMASNTTNKNLVAEEFGSLHNLFLKIKSYENKASNLSMDILSMGMSGDYPIALQHGSNMVRIGSALFGKRSG